jgi:hypothetical protein
LRLIEKLGKSDNSLNAGALHGVAGAAPQKATEEGQEVQLKICLLQYSDIFGDD